MAARRDHKLKQPEKQDNLKISLVVKMIDCVDYYGTPKRKQSNPLKNNIDQWQKNPFKKPKKTKQKQL